MSARGKASLIAAELTPRGGGAVSVVEFVGAHAIAHVREIGSLASLAVGDVRVARLAFSAGLVDEALVVCRAVDHVEIHLHGSPALVRAALDGFETASSTPRSIEDRARELLERAPCEAAARILLDQAEGCLRAELEHLARLDPHAARALAAELAARGRRARYALDPALVVLAGPVNAGKSTLFNVLAGEARALVADEPGTTRDVLAADVLLGAWPARLLDTAGDRDLAEPTPARAVEAEGQRRARSVRASADLVLWLLPTDAPRIAAPAGVEVLYTQADRSSAARAGAISALVDPARARRRVGEILRARFTLPLEPWQPGAAVPFERAQTEALEACARGDLDPRDLARTWLARP